MKILFFAQIFYYEIAFQECNETKCRIYVRTFEAKFDRICRKIKKGRCQFPVIVLLINNIWYGIHTQLRENVVTTCKLPLSLDRLNAYRTALFR